MHLNAPYWELAQALRSLRERSGLTYRAMAEKIADPGCSATTLSRADQGDHLPRKSVVVAYGLVCGASKETMVAIWSKERARAQRRAAPVTPVSRSPLLTQALARPRVLELIHEPPQLLSAMQRVRQLAGDPSLRELERRADRMGLPPLPKSTTADILAGVRLPTEQQLMTYVAACGVPESRAVRWRSAYRRTLSVSGVTAG